MMKLIKLKQQLLRRFYYPLILYFLIGLFCGFIQAQTNPESAVILEATELHILGKTNINSFRCHLVQNRINDTLATMINPITDQSCIFEGLEILFRVADFECNPPLMTNDFRQLLKAEQYPFIKMHIERMDHSNPDNSQEKELLTVVVNLFIAGVRKSDQITDAQIERQYGKLILTGIYHLNLTDFKITPPTKLLGTVHTKDVVKINFSIVLKVP